MNPPLLEVVEGNPQPSAKQQSETPDSQSAPASLIIPETFDDVAIPTHQIHVKSPTSLHAGRRKQSAGSQLGLLKIIAGGFAGLAIGQMILWWLPQPYSTDPLELAPKLPKSMAFLAPPQHRNGLGLVPPSATSVEQQQRSPWDAATQQSGDPQAIAAPDVSPKGPDALLGFVDESLLGLDERRQRLNAAIAADKEFQTPSMPLATRDDWYQKLRELAFAVTFADTTERKIGGFASDVREFLSTLAGEQWKTELASSLADETFDNDDQHRQGVVISGRVAEIGPAGRRFRTLIELSGPSNRVVEVVSSKNPQDLRAYKTGDRVVILGTVVIDPNLYLLGYEGTADRVIVGGLPLRLPSP